MKRRQQCPLSLDEWSDWTPHSGVGALHSVSPEPQRQSRPIGFIWPKPAPKPRIKLKVKP